MLRAYKYRIYPTDEQKTFIRQNVGGNRWFYNYAVNKINDHYEKTGEHISAQYNVCRELPLLKKEENTSWLKDIDSKSLIWTSTHVDSSYKSFFNACKDRKKGTKNDGGKPVYKKKSYNGSYTTYQGIEVFWSKNEIKIPKLKDRIKAVLHRKFYGKIKQATLSYNNSNQYFISILVDDNTEKEKEKKVTYDTTIGIDLGVKNSIILDNGEKYETFSLSEKENKKIKKLHKALSKKEKNSKNYEKARIKLAKYQNKLSNRKIDRINNITHDLTHNDKTSAICLENLNVKGMLKNHHLAKSIMENSFNDIKTKLSYKSEWNGIKLIEIDRFYPSSKTCNKCGYINNELKLSTRSWTCPNCGEKHDRDINAAINIKNEGYRLLTEAKQ